MVSKDWTGYCYCRILENNRHEAHRCKIARFSGEAQVLLEMLRVWLEMYRFTVVFGTVFVAESIF